MKVSRIVVLILPVQAFSLVRMDDHRSSYFSQRHNTRVTGHAISRMTAASFLTCVQICLVHSACKSVNFEKNHICELHDSLPSEQNTVVDDQTVLGWIITVESETYEFTSLGSCGEKGPVNDKGYIGTNLEGSVKIVKGLQTWTVPYTAAYTIEVSGASGANGSCTKSTCNGWSIGGRGATIIGTLNLQKGTKLKLLVGQKGLAEPFKSISINPGGGGGGSFVTSIDDTPLIIAGGGGGGGSTIGGISRDGDPGQATTIGSCYGGANGTGGLRYDKVSKLLSSSPMFPKSPAFLSSAGAGYISDGDCFGNSAPKSFLNGGQGGKGGGFGGGGFPLAFCPGGGGGYSGGGVLIDGDSCWAGGGGSLNNGYNQFNYAGRNSGDGRIKITLMV